MPLYIIIAIVAIVAVILVWVIATYNKFIKLRNRVEEGFSTMDVYLKKRWDLVPNLVETVKGYVAHENATLKEIVKLRKGDYDNMSEEEKVKTGNKRSGSLSKLFALAEDYPELKASESFNSLNEKLETIEDDIASSRKYYNGTVREFNNLAESFPSKIVATIFGFKSKTMFGIEQAERENVKVKF